MCVCVCLCVCEWIRTSCHALIIGEQTQRQWDKHWLSWLPEASDNPAAGLCAIIITMYSGLSLSLSVCVCVCVCVCSAAQKVWSARSHRGEMEEG